MEECLQENFRSRLLELQQKRAELNSEFEVLKREAVDQCREIIEAFGLAAADLKLVQAKPSASRGRSKTKYRNPDDETKAWSGIGVSPGWFKSALQVGVAKEEMEIR